jgi:hypothetical protein
MNLIIINIHKIIKLKNINMEENLYDILVIEFQKDGNSLGSISMKKSDIDTLKTLHGHSIEVIAGDMAKTIEDAINKRN